MISLYSNCLPFIHIIALIRMKLSRLKHVFLISLVHEVVIDSVTSNSYENVNFLLSLGSNVVQFKAKFYL